VLDALALAGNREQPCQNVSFVTGAALVLEQERAIELEERLDALRILETMRVRRRSKWFDTALLGMFWIGMLPVVDHMAGAAGNVGAVCQDHVTRILEVARGAAPDAHAFHYVRLIIESFTALGGEAAEARVLGLRLSGIALQELLESFSV